MPPSPILAVTVKTDMVDARSTRLERQAERIVGVDARFDHLDRDLAQVHERRLGQFRAVTGIRCLHGGRVDADE